MITYRATVLITADIPGLSGSDGTFVSGPIDVTVADEATAAEITAAVLVQLLSPSASPMFAVGHLWVPLPDGQFGVVSSNEVTAFQVAWLQAEPAQ